ncbi:hypothetical protein UF75_0832 [Desulfosporosinus sp. I2]|nr:hypothetical protein UF75_0832 [Desulfosporosinus sp. I2]
MILKDAIIVLEDWWHLLFTYSTLIRPMRKLNHKVHFKNNLS